MHDGWVETDNKKPVPVLGKFAEPFVVKQGMKDIKHTLETFKHLLEA